MLEMSEFSLQQEKNADSPESNEIAPDLILAESTSQMRHLNNTITSNPFAGGSYAGNAVNPDCDPDSAAESEPHFPYIPTIIPQQELRALPYKTSNRILDDMRFTPGFLASRRADDVASLLNARPIFYKNCVSARLPLLDHTCLILNNPISYAPSVSKKEHEKDHVRVSTVRGLIVDTRAYTPPQNRVVGHFKVQILDPLLPKTSSANDKNQYHLVPREKVSVDDLNFLSDKATRGEGVLEDAFYKKMDPMTSHMMRVTVYKPEFSADDLAPLTSAHEIRDRYLRKIERDPDCGLSLENVPSPVHCFQTLLKVLKGPVLLPANEVVHTISKGKTHLDAKIDTELLFRKLHFTVGEDPDSLVPPNLSLSGHALLRENYIRKATELIFVGKSLKTKGRVNDFDVSYSFSDNLSQVHAILGEVDKHMTLTLAWGDVSNKYAAYIALSSYAYFQDELIIRCYEHTVNSDPVNKMHYVDSFTQLLAVRASNGSARLLSYYNHQFLRGQMFGLADYRSALEALGIVGLPDETIVDEDAVVEMYSAACKQDPKNYTYFSKQMRTICAIRSSPYIEEFLRNELVPQSVALEELRIEDVTEDEVVITAYEYRLDEVIQAINFVANSPEIVCLQRCLLSLAVARKSYILMSYIDVHMPELLACSRSFTLEECMLLLGIEDATPDFDVVSKFQEKLVTSEFGDEIDIRVLRTALELVAQLRLSEILMSFLRNGKVHESLLPPENWPTGLDNIGNTCYLNLLLQYYFSIKPLREVILRFDEKNVDLLKLSARKIGGRLVEEAESGRSVQFIYRLQELFSEMISTIKRYILPSKELVYLSFLPLSQLVTFEEVKSGQDPMLSDTEMEDLLNENVNESVALGSDPFLDSQPPEPFPKSVNSDLIQMDSPSSEGNMLEIDTGAETETETKADVTMGLVEKEPQTKIMRIGSEQMASAIEIGRQQDVTECIENVTFQIETALEPEYLENDGEQFDLVKRLFSGRTKQTITPLESDVPPRISYERFFSLIINVGDHPRDIYDALDNYFGENIVRLEEGKVKMSATILKTPEILQFHVQRVLFDRERLMAYKSLEVIPFAENIYLDRYLDTEDSEVLSKRQEVFEWKTEISRLSDEKLAVLAPDPTTKLSVVDSLNSTLRYLKSKALEHNELHVEQATLDAIEHQIDVFRARFQAIDTRIDALQLQISDQFRSYKKVGYTLFAVFIHRGEASYGHYWIYIKDPQRNIYRKYNDDSVTEVPALEVFDITETNTATPYYMVFVKDELIEEYIEPLKRVIKC